MHSFIEPSLTTTVTQMQTSMCPTNPSFKGSAALPKPLQNTSRSLPSCDESTYLAGINISFKAYSPHSRKAAIQSSWKLSKAGSFWVSLYGVRSASIPPLCDTNSAACSSYSLRSYLPYDGLSEALLILSPIGTVTGASRRIIFLADRDLSRQSRAHCPTEMTTRFAVVHEFSASLKRRFNNLLVTGYDTCWNVDTVVWEVIASRTCGRGL